MANQTQNIEQRIRLVLEDQVDLGRAAKEIRKVFEGTRSLTKATQEYEDATRKATRETDGLRKALFSAGRALGGVLALYGGGKIFAGLYDNLNKSNEAWMRFAIVSGDANKSLRDLRSVYADMEGHNKALTISLTDAAETLASFASRSIAARSVLSSGLSKQLIKIQEDLSNLVPADTAKKMMSDLQNALPPSELARIFDTYKMGSEEMFAAIANQSDEAIVAYDNLRNALGDVSKANDPAIRSMKQWSTIMNQMGALWSNAKIKFLDTFGSAIQGTLERLSKEGIPAIYGKMKEFFQWIEAKKSSITQVFDTIYKAITIIGKGLGMVNPAVLAFSASLLFPGVKESLGLVMKGLQGIIGSLTGMPALINPIIVGLGAATLALQQFYTWWDKGAGETWGGKIADAMYGDVNLQADAQKQADAIRKIDEDTAKKRGITYQKLMKDRQKALEKNQKEDADFDARGRMFDNLKKKAQDLWKTMTQGAMTARSGFARFQEIEEIFKKLSAGLSGMTGTVNDLVQIMGTAGLTTEIAGKNIAEYSAQVADTIHQTLPAMKSLAEEQLKMAQARVAEAKTDQDRVSAFKNLQMATQKLAQVSAMVTSEVKARNAALEIAEQRQSEQVSIAKANLDISRSLYGSAAMGVQAAKNIVSSLEEQKKLVQGQLKNVEEMLMKEPKNQELLKQRNELLLKGKQITKEQLDMVKELRDGYLSAVQAQAFGAGRFEKIIISQENNMAKALDMNIAKKNYLLGQTGNQAAAGNAQPWKFSDTGIGDISSPGGQALNSDRVAEQSIQNVGDPATRELMKENQRLLKSMYGPTTSGIDKYTQQLSGAGGMIGIRGGVNQGLTEGRMINAGVTPSRPAASSARVRVPQISPSSNSGDATKIMAAAANMLLKVAAMVDNIRGTSADAPEMTRPGSGQTRAILGGGSL